MCLVTSRIFKLALTLLALSATGAVADAIFLKTGRQLNVAVREISEGTGYLVSNGEIRSLPLAEIKKIIIAGAEAPAAVATAPTSSPARPAPPAAVTPPAPPPALELVNTVSGFDRGVLAVQARTCTGTAILVNFPVSRERQNEPSNVQRQRRDCDLLPQSESAVDPQARSWFALEAAHALVRSRCSE